MGLKGAPAHFQQHMANKKISSLLYNICEMYLYDVIIYGDTEKEFTKNVKLVLQKKKFFVNTI